MRRLAALLVAGAGVFATGGGCGAGSSRYDEVERWQCFEDASSCDCFGTPDSATVEDPRPRVVACRPALGCCFVTARAQGGFECSCLVAPSRSSAAGEGGSGGDGAGDPRLDCHAAAVDAGSTEVVTRCPPVPLDDSSVCSLAFESCDPEYLADNGLIACCEGTRCRKNQYGVDVCEPE